MTYKFITEVAHDLQNEEGQPDAERMGFLTGLWSDLYRAERRQAELLARRPTKPATNTFADIRQFQEDSANYQKELDAANAEVIYCKQFFLRMGGALDGNGRLNVAASRRVVLYDRQLAQQGLTQVTFRGGVLFDSGGKPLDTSSMVTAFSGPGKAIYALSATNHGLGGGFHVSSHSVGERHHSSLLAATQAWIAAAGEIEVKRGIIRWISNKSGHYQPTIDHFLQVLHHLQKNGVPLQFRVTLEPGGTPYSSVDEFMEKNHLDDDSYDYMNLTRSYKDHLVPAVLAPHGWEYRPTAPRKGVYDMYTDRFIPHREVRSWLKNHGFTGAEKQHSGFGR